MTNTKSIVRKQHEAQLRRIGRERVRDAAYAGIATKLLVVLVAALVVGMGISYMLQITTMPIGH